MYVERLSVRRRWWVVVLAIAVLGTLEVSAGFSWKVGLIVLAVMVAPAVAILVAMSRLSLRVDSSGLHAGGETMAFEDMESVEALDAAATRLQIGPRADPSARLVFRGFIPSSVLVRPLSSSSPAPYWLVSTRHPQQVVAAVERAARAAFSDH